jgi:hypothetical protein
MKESESTVFSRFAQRRRQPDEIVVTCYLVEAGEYRGDGRITELGKQQVSQAAEYIRQKAGGRTVTVLQYGDPMLVSVLQTAAILAQELEGPVFDDEVYLTVFWALPTTTQQVNNGVMSVLWRALGCKAEMHLAMPMHHSGASPVIKDYPEGAQPGSVNVFSFTYDRKTGRIVARDSSK